MKIPNFFQCIAPTWYISVDMQFFIVSPIFLYLLARFGSKCYWIIGAISVASGLSITICSYVYQFNWINHTGDKYADWDPLIFHNTWHRIGPWLIGMLLGYYMFQTRDQRLALSKNMVIALWSATFISIVAVLFTPWPFYYFENQDVHYFAIYSGVHKSLWAAATAWIILACVKGERGFVNWFLSLSIWQPLAKLTYSIYIIHNPFMIMTTTLQRTSEYLSIYRTFQLFLGIYLFSVLMAVPWTLTFEVPLMNTETELFRLKDKKKTTK